MNTRRLESRSIRIILTAAFAIAGLAGPSRPAPAGAVVAQLAFNPASSNVTIGGTVNVDITIANVTDLGGYDLALTFNPALVHVVSLTDSNFVGIPPSGNVVLCTPAVIDNIVGTASAACVTFLSVISGVPSAPIAGTGVSTSTPVMILQAQFTGVATGTSSLTLTGTPPTTLQDPPGADIPVTLGTGSISASPSVGGVASQADAAALPVRRAPARGGEMFAVGGFGLVAVAALAGGAWAARTRRRSG